MFLRTVGETLAREYQAENVGVILGLAINIKRSPLCGRNFEYLSQDPCLSGELAAAYIQGAQATEAELAYFSLEKQVTPDTPPIFLWQTATDELVPVENSYLMAMALRKAGVPFAHHVFPAGMHGLSLADADWAAGRFGEPYCMEQMMGIAAAWKNGEIEVPEQARPFLNVFAHPDTAAERSFPMGKPVPEVAVWPELADAWMRARSDTKA